MTDRSTTDPHNSKQSASIPTKIPSSPNPLFYLVSTEVLTRMISTGTGTGDRPLGALSSGLDACSTASSCNPTNAGDRIRFLGKQRKQPYHSTPSPQPQSPLSTCYHTSCPITLAIRSLHNNSFHKVEHKTWPTKNKKEPALPGRHRYLLITLHRQSQDGMLTVLPQRLPRVRQILHSRHGSSLRRCIRRGRESPRRPRCRRVRLYTPSSLLQLQARSSSHVLTSKCPIARQPKMSPATSPSWAASSKA